MELGEGGRGGRVLRKDSGRIGPWIPQCSSSPTTLYQINKTSFKLSSRALESLTVTLSWEFQTARAHGMESGCKAECTASPRQLLKAV